MFLLFPGKNMNYIPENIRGLIDLQFKEPYCLYQHQINSYHYFIETSINLFLNSNSHIDENNYLVFTNINFQADPITPMEARSKHISYFGTLYSTVIQMYNDILVDKQDNVPISRIPIMLRSKYSSTINECVSDPGCYFIIRGQEKVILSSERIAQQRILNFSGKTVQYSKGVYSLTFGKNGEILSTSPYLSDIPLFILIRAFTSDILSDLHISKLLLNEDEKKIYPSIIASSGINNQKDAKSWLCQHSGLTEEFLNKILVNFLPHTQPSVESKIRNLCLMAQNLFHDPSDRDSYCNKRIDVSGDALFSLFCQTHTKMITNCKCFFKKNNVCPSSPISIISCIKIQQAEKSFQNALTVGNWGNMKNKEGISRPLERLSFLQSVSELRRIVTPGFDEKNKSSDMRQIHCSQVGFICVVETPEGDNIGLVKNLTMSTTVTTPYNDNDIKKLLQKSSFFTDSISLYKIIVNGDHIGYTNNQIEIINEFTQHKLHNRISRFVGISVNPIYKIITINSDGGRLVRPILRVEAVKNKIIPTASCWEELLTKFPELIEYIDVEQASHLSIATSIDTIIYSTTHVEIHPSLLLGMTAVTIPFLNMNQAPRNSYQYNQAKQAMGIYISNYKKRFDNANLLYHPEQPIVSTIGAKYTGLQNLPNGQNVIIAIACFTGYNQEDSMVLNASSVERGLFLSSHLNKYNSTITKTKDSKNTIHKKPDSIRSNINYETLNSKGFAPEETELNYGDAIIGKVCANDTDLSEIYTNIIPGKVDYVETGLNGDGYEMFNVRVRSLRVPMIGDKFSTRSGQKFTCGILMRQEDMPYTENGIIPDMIINPNCIPRRMTIGQLLESVVGKIGAIKFESRDGTPFINRDIHKICKELEDLGYDGSGCETMYSGITGKKYPNKVFIGPVYCQRLKHMVADKIHARAKGSYQVLTRQPPEGRSKNGGLRFGEMEKDASISHGISAFLKERFMECSDKYTVETCQHCGLIGSTEKGCCGDFKMNSFQVPYSYKILCQELMAINIAPRIICKKESINRKVSENGFTLLKTVIKLMPYEEEISLTNKIKKLENTCFEEGFIEKINCIEETIKLPLSQEDLTYCIPYEVHFSCSFFIPLVGMKVLCVIKDISENCLLCTHKSLTILITKNGPIVENVNDSILVTIEALKIVEGMKSIKAFGKI